MNNQASQLGCKSGDMNCLCNTDNYKFGIRDCTKQACPADDSQAVVSQAVDKCPGGKAGAGSQSGSGSGSDSDSGDGSGAGAGGATATGTSGATGTGAQTGTMTGASATGGAGSGASSKTGSGASGMVRIDLPIPSI